MLQQWAETIDSFRQQQEQAARLLQMQLEKLRIELTELEDRLRDSADANPEVGQWMEFEKRQLERLVHTCDENLIVVNSRQRLVKKVAAELADSRRPTSLRQWADATMQAARQCWHYEIIAVDDRPITVGKVVSGLLLLLIGIGLEMDGLVAAGHADPHAAGAKEEG